MRFHWKSDLAADWQFYFAGATIHAQERGFGYDQILKDHCAWVLSRLSIEMYEYPGYDQDIIVETWVEDVSRFYTQRCFAFINEDGKTVGYARSVWAAIDLENRRPIDILVWRQDLIEYVDREKKCPIEKMPKIPEVIDQESQMGYSIRYSDIDINKHMNSVKYIEHTLNVFGLEFFEQKKISRFDVVYLREGRFGEKLKIYKEEKTNEYIVDTRKDDDSVCRSRIVWNGLDNSD